MWNRSGSVLRLAIARLYASKALVISKEWDRYARRARQSVQATKILAFLVTRALSWASERD
jgi:hypothetical protein